MKLNKIKVNYSEFCYFFTLSRKEQIQYWFNLYDELDAKPGKLDTEKLRGFFDMIKDLEEEAPDLEALKRQDIEADREKIDVMIDDEIIMMESNSIRAIRQVTSRFMQFGYILQRDIKSERMFRRDKVTKYLRVFKIIDQIQSFSLS